MNLLQFKNCASSRGFTLVEAIVVMAILSIVMLAIMSFIIPTQQSMKMQSNVTDVQSNLNLAMNVMTRDLLMAGFLVDPAYDPPLDDSPGYWKGDNPLADMQPGPIFWQGNDNTDDDDDLTIRTRIIGNAFAVMGGAAEDAKVTPTHPDMVSNFCNGNTVKTAKVRVFNPVTMTDPGCEPGDYSCDIDAAKVDGNLVSVNACSANDFTLNRPVAPSAVIVGVREDVLPMQTIRYRVNNGALERIVNGNTQVLARGVTSVNFAYRRLASGNINRVDIDLTGVVSAMKAGEAELGEKVRTLTSSVNLRNSF